MPTSASRETLLARHSAISQKIESEQSRPGSSDWLLKSLKRQKLHLKEQIEGIG
jgi:hypothetical protein